MNFNTNDILDEVWAESTDYEDFYNIIYENGFNKKRLLDVGCGMGTMLKYMKNLGMDCYGIEPSIYASDLCKSEGINCYCGDLFDFNVKENEKFDVVSLNNVLEHIENPEQTLNKCKSLMNDRGFIRIKVPNDFNKFQEEITSKFDIDPWWICIPDHINYFNNESLKSLLDYCEYEVIYKTCDFPMEFFLLMGKNYIKNNEIGKEVHKMRKNFEMNMSSELRREIYSSLSNINLGRNIIMYAKVK